MKTKITGFRQDDESHWVADLACGHSRHFRHNPPWQVREWVLTEEGRERFIGSELECKKCKEGNPPSPLCEGDLCIRQDFFNFD